MPGPCYYHPTYEAAGTCIQCGMPACTDCLQQVGGRPVCSGCAAAFQERLAQQAPVYAANYAAPPSIYGAPPGAYAGPAVGVNPSDKN